jgi:oligopeptide transport system ATP-binding protein
MTTTNAQPQPTPSADAATLGEPPILRVDDLHVEFATRDGVSRAVRGISFDVYRGRTTAILGESGSGKSVTAQAIMGILDMPPASIPQGSVTFDGVELIGMKETERRLYRGQRIAMIFQDALSALNPVVSVGNQIGEMFRVHEGMSRNDARDAAVEMMRKVRIPAAEKRVKDYPHQFSGGMRQRIMIAMMIALRPDVLIADEPTTALDVTVQKQIMDLLAELRETERMGLILITHDLGVVADVADEILVMYGGRPFEQCDVETVFARPANPYSIGLMRSIPRVSQKRDRMPAIPGLPPNPLALPPGCAFAPRCSRAEAKCHEQEPPLIEVGPSHTSACWFAEEVLHVGIPE